MYDLYKSLIFNHEWTRMNTNSLAAGADKLQMSLLCIMDF